jgi:hypothetical protein
MADFIIILASTMLAGILAATIAIETVVFLTRRRRP